MRSLSRKTPGRNGTGLPKTGRSRSGSFPIPPPAPLSVQCWKKHNTARIKLSNRKKSGKKFFGPKKRCQFACRDTDNYPLGGCTTDTSFFVTTKPFGRIAFFPENAGPPDPAKVFRPQKNPEFIFQQEKVPALTDSLIGFSIADCKAMTGISGTRCL